MGRPWIPPNPNATDDCINEIPGTAPNYDPCSAGPGSDTDVFMAGVDRRWSRRGPIGDLVDDGGGAQQWFPWADHKADGSLAIAWDQDTTAAAPADTFDHVLWDDGGTEVLGPMPRTSTSRSPTGPGSTRRRWPAICGPAGYTDGGEPAEGKDCNVFHGDYTGLAVESPDGAVHVVWTGLNRLATSPQVDFYIGGEHDGYAQDAMYARSGPI